VSRLVLIISALGLATACGVPPAKNMSSTQALTQTAEWLEFESPSVRLELFRDLAKQSLVQSGSNARTVLFPMLVNGAFEGAPGFDPATDLLSAGDAGTAVDLVFDRGDRFGEERREAFQGLSEREAAELIARSLLNQWNIKAVGQVTVVRVSGAPYAAAWIDGQIRLNPSFICLAATPATR
jgi:hypothetical protein